jgi:Ca2+-binding RTX toxin-like protein
LDVVPADIVMKTFTANGFKQGSVTYRIKGDSPTAPFEIGFYSSVDTSVDGADELLSTLTIDEADDLTAGTHTVTFVIGKDVRLPGAGLTDTEADYHLLAVADYEELRAESNTNNTSVFQGVYQVGKGPVMAHGKLHNDKISMAGAGRRSTLNFNGTEYNYNVRGVDYRIRSHSGNDTIDARDLEDFNLFAWGGDGNDKIYGGDGDDYIDGGPGSDLAQGNRGRNVIVESTDQARSSSTRASMPLSSDAFFEQMGESDGRRTKLRRLPLGR